MVSPEPSALNYAMTRLKANLLRCCQSIIAEFTRKMSPTARRYWYLSIGCSLVVGALMALAFLYDSDLPHQIIAFLVNGGGFVFGAGMVAVINQADAFSKNAGY